MSFQLESKNLIKILNKKLKMLDYHFNLGRIMKQSKIKFGLVIFICFILFPLFVVDARAALDPGPPGDPPPVHTVGGQSNLHIEKNNIWVVWLQIDIQANVLDGVRLDSCYGSFDILRLIGFSLEFVTLYHTFYYIAGALWKYNISFVYRLKDSNQNYIEFTFSSAIDITGTLTAHVLFNEGGTGDSHEWTFKIQNVSGGIWKDIIKLLKWYLFHP